MYVYVAFAQRSDPHAVAAAAANTAPEAAAAAAVAAAAATTAAAALATNEINKDKRSHNYTSMRTDFYFWFATTVVVVDGRCKFSYRFSTV